MLLIYVPCKNRAEARKIGRILVRERLACCANIIGKTDSIFPWLGKIEETAEALLFLKTLSPYNKVRKRIEQLHSYKIPAIAAVKLSNINPKYNRWARSVQKK